MTGRWLLPVAVLLLASVTPTLAAEPTLGGRLNPAQLVWERDRDVKVTNLSTIPVVVRLTVEGEGWSLGDQPARTLQASEAVTVPVVAAGEDGAVIRALLTPATTQPGMDAATLILEATARHLSPWEQIPSSAWLLLALSALVASWAVLRRLRRR